MSKSIDFSSLTLQDALDLAVLVEEEAQERYLELADQMDTHRTWEAAEFFRFMAGNEAKHGLELSKKRRTLFGLTPRRVDRSMLWDVEAPSYDTVRAFMHAREAYTVALASEEKARQFFVENPGERMASLMIKEFGIYPPGCLVRLASGEIAIVVRRGAAANTPQVVALTDRSGRVLPAPVTLDTGRAAHTVVGSLPEPRTRLRIPAQWLYPEAQAA